MRTSKTETVTTSTIDSRLESRDIIEISEDTIVLPGIVVKDKEWDLRPIGNLRMENTPDAEVVLRWEVYCSDMPPTLISVLKKYACMVVKHYGRISLKQPLSPKTIVTDARHLAKLFAAAYWECGVTQLSQFTKSVCAKAIGEDGAHVSLRAALLRLVHPEMVKVLETGPMPIGVGDIRKLKYRMPKGDSGYETLPTDLFFFLSATCEAKIIEYMNLIKIEPTEPKQQSHFIEAPPAYFSDLVDVMKALKANRQEAKRLLAAGHSRSDISDEHFRRLKTQFGVDMDAVQRYLNDIQMAATIFIFLYTGFRYGAGISLKKGCVHMTNGFFEIVGIDNKNKRQSASVYIDRWVATPAMVDAIKVLEHLASYLNTDNLFVSVNGTGDLDDRNVMTNKTLNDRLKGYLRQNDVDGLYGSWNLHSHQFREGLTYQLIRAGAKLPYISMQLKHMTYAAAQLSNDLPSQVTLRYGNIPKALLSSATGELKNRVSEEIAESLWGENKHFAGGGAEKHVQRTEAFFQGMGLSGEERVEYIHNRAKQGIPLFFTGTGVCGKNFSSPDKVRDNPPPCLGDLRCNPFDCDNAITPETHRIAIELRLLKARNQAFQAIDADVQQFHRSLEVRYQSMLDQLDCVDNNDQK